MDFDAVLLLSFGGPDGPDDVLPFLGNVLRGRPVPPERVEQVASHYMRFGGRSPINDQNRALLDALTEEFDRRGRPRRVYWGNRNWKPYLADTVAAMRDDGIEQAVVFVTSAYSSHSSCRQYLDDLERARHHVGAGSPALVKIRPYFDHPGFVTPLAEGLRAAVSAAPAGSPVLMAAHSIPESMAVTCGYESQLRTTAGLVADAAGVASWQLVYQSRSGPPTQPWLGPDILDAIAQMPPATEGVVVTPIGFVSDHMEVVYDLDTQAAEDARERDMVLVRSPTPGTHPAFVRMVGQLIEELEAGRDRHPHMCHEGCCPAPSR